MAIDRKNWQGKDTYRYGIKNRQDLVNNSKVRILLRFYIIEIIIMATNYR